MSSLLTRAAVCDATLSFFLSLQPASKTAATAIKTAVVRTTVFKGRKREGVGVIVDRSPGAFCDCECGERMKRTGATNCAENEAKTPHPREWRGRQNGQSSSVPVKQVGKPHPGHALVRGRLERDLYPKFSRSPPASE